nr:hypothetical protein StreXyl84_07340 [Streptomyces sp. Xyl84]
MGGGPGGGPGGGADGIRNIQALPGAIARGGQLAITVQGCRTGGTAVSGAFARTPLRPFNGAGEIARVVATIRQDVRPGTYEITVECAGRTLTRPGAFTVVGGVRGGLGGASKTGATKTDVAIGGGLLAAGAIGGGVFWTRRRPQRRG